MYLSVFGEAFEIYVPLAFSKELKLNVVASQKNILQRTTFVINLKKMNPLKLARNLRYKI
jgi:hypothetical protein